MKPVAIMVIEKNYKTEKAHTDLTADNSSIYKKNLGYKIPNNA